MATLVGQLGLSLLNFIWQGALIAAVAGVGMVALRNSRPQARYALGCAALFACLLWPALSLSMRLQYTGASAGHPATGVLDGAFIVVRAGTPLDWLHGHFDAIVLAWAACACALSLRMAIGLWWIGRAARGEHGNAEWQTRMGELAQRFGITRAVRLRIVDGIASPITAGWWRPVVLLPSSLLTGMPPDLLEALIAHELGHIKRADYLVNLLQNVIETLLFYHPAVWWLSHRIRIERERIADDLAAEKVGERRLALALSELEKCQFSHNKVALAATGGDLMKRIKRLLRPAQQGLHWKAALPALGLAGALLIGCAQLPARAASGQFIVVPPATAASDANGDKAMVRFDTCKKPVYPPDALRSERTGTVTMAFLIDENGRAINSRIVNSSGHRDLDATALVAIYKCTFKPATLNGKAEKAWLQMQYVWTLQ